jgi:hypothetical protein
MEDPSPLEEYLAAAPVDLHAHFPGGGGHANKQLVLVRGGIGALAKPAMDDQSRRQANAEVAGYLLARLMDWDDLVPVTVFRTVPSPSGDVEASVQVLWPSFKTAAELGIGPDAIADEDGWRAALLDVLLMNSDRNPSNWGRVAESGLALIDHGHCLIGGQPGLSSEFATNRADQELPATMREALERVTSANGGRLRDVADADHVDRIVERAATLVSGGVLALGE